VQSSHDLSANSDKTRLLTNIKFILPLYQFLSKDKKANGKKFKIMGL